MRQIQFDLKIEFGSGKQAITQVMDLLEKYNKNINAHLLQINAEQLTDVARVAAEKALLSAKFRVQGFTKKLAENFIVKVDKRQDRRIIKVSHGMYGRIQKDIVRKATNRDHKIPVRALYETIDTGRKAYQIVKAGNQSKRDSPLVFKWKRMNNKFVVFHWKGPKGGRRKFIIVRPNSGPVDYATGARFTEAAFKAVEAVINARVAKMQSLASI